MKLFEVQTDLTSFTYPIVKIIVCLVVILFCVVRNQIFHLSSVWANVIVTILCFALTICSILCLYISIGELFYVSSNRRSVNYQSSDAQLLSIREITKIVSQNDILEIEVYTPNNTIKIGSISECKHSSSVFENKLYYISNSEYDTIEQFSECLGSLFPTGHIPVLKIDGVKIDDVPFNQKTGDGLREP